MAKKETYTGSDIQLLDSISAIRIRSGMYAGSLEDTALHLVKEIMDNSIDEYMNGHATEIKVNLDTKENKVTIIDDGRGIPVDIHPQTGKYAMEVLVTENHAGGKFNKSNYDNSGGLNGVGCTVVNALSSYFRVESIRDGYSHSMEFSKGQKTKEFTKTKVKDAPITRGTIITFIPDSEIMKKGIDKINVTKLMEDLDTRSYINPKLKITFTKDKSKPVVYYKENGLVDHFSTMKNLLTPPISFEDKDSQGNSYSIALAYTSESDEQIHSYINGMITEDGTHVSGLKSGLEKAFKAYMSDPNSKILPKSMKIAKIKGEDIRAGLVAYVAVKHSNPEYKGQTKDKLTNKDVEVAVNLLTEDKMKSYIYANEKVCKPVAKRIVEFAKGRISASKFKESIVKKSNKPLTFQISDKFKNCWGKNPKENELLIIEGKSAGNSVNTGRDSKTQAVYALKGKILNVEGISLDKVMKNAEIAEICNILFKTNSPKVIEKFNYQKDLPYDKIIVLTDADDDGIHIESLALTFFYRYTRLIQEGRVYLALPPKYSYQEKGKFTYFKNDEELSNFEYSKLKESIKIKSKGYNLKDLLTHKKEYIEIYDDALDNQVLATPVLMDAILGLSGSLKPSDLGLSTKDKITYSGIYKATYNEVNLKELVLEAKRLKSLVPYTGVLEATIKSKSGREETYKFESIRDFYNVVDDKLSFAYNYFKGLGEADGPELYDTTLDPKTRHLIQVKLDDMQESKANEITTSFFSSKTTNERKDIMREYFKKGTTA